MWFWVSLLAMLLTARMLVGRQRLHRARGNARWRRRRSLPLTPRFLKRKQGWNVYLDLVFPFTRDLVCIAVRFVLGPLWSIVCAIVALGYGTEINKRKDFFLEKKTKEMRKKK
jgi:hypothetical protein